MNLLAIDTATGTFSVALAAGKNTFIFEADAGMRHSELIMDIIDMLMKKAAQRGAQREALRPEDLNGVVCMGGPGSFTGLRIGFSVAKGIALALGIPFAPIPTLDCMARPFSSWPGIVAPVIDAKKSAFFCALYRNGRRLCPAMDAQPAEIFRIIAETAASEQTLLFGPDAQMLYEKLPFIETSTGTPTLPSPANIILGKGLRWGNAGTLLAIAAERDIFVNSDNNLFSGPEYIRKSDAEIERKEKS